MLRAATYRARCRLPRRAFPASTARLLVPPRRSVVLGTPCRETVCNRLGRRRDEARRHAQTLAIAIAGDHALCAKRERASDRELADRTAAPHRDRVVPYDRTVAIHRADPAPFAPAYRCANAAAAFRAECDRSSLDRSRLRAPAPGAARRTFDRAGHRGSSATARQPERRR